MKFSSRIESSRSKWFLGEACLRPNVSLPGECFPLSALELQLSTLIIGADVFRVVADNSNWSVAAGEVAEGETRNSKVYIGSAWREESTIMKVREREGLLLVDKSFEFITSSNWKLDLEHDHLLLAPTSRSKSKAVHFCSNDQTRKECSLRQMMKQQAIESDTSRKMSLAKMVRKVKVAFE